MHKVGAANELFVTLRKSHLNLARHRRFLLGKKFALVDNQLMLWR